MADMWIKVTDQLPPVMQQVYLTWDFLKVRVGFYYDDDDHFYARASEWHFEICKLRPTHWSYRETKG